MKIVKIQLLHLRNDAHFQFHTEFKDLVEKNLVGENGYKPPLQKVEEQYNSYKPLYEILDNGLKKINKSQITEQIQEADKARDEIWAGLVEMNKAATKHFESIIREAAERLKIVFDTYGNVAIQPLNEETSAINNILQELEGKYSNDAEAVGIKQWVAELKVRNTALSDLMKNRFDETASKSDIVVKEARAELDKAYRTIAEKIDALVIVDGVNMYENFIRTWNAVVEKYTNSMKHRRGRPMCLPTNENGNVPTNAGTTPTNSNDQLQGAETSLYLGTYLLGMSLFLCKNYKTGEKGGI
jgi:transcription elongation GreA/GreB family factor